MRKTGSRQEPRETGRVLARVLADELRKVRVAGAAGPTCVVTVGGGDITNLAGDNDGPLEI